MERGIDESKQKEPMFTLETEKGEELRASSTNMTHQLGGSGGFSECQGSKHERNIFPTQMPLLVYPAEKLNQHAYLDLQDDSKDLSYGSDFNLDDEFNIADLFISSESQKLQTRPNDAERDEETPKSLPTRALYIPKDVCGDSIMDLMMVNISPDDVVSTIGIIQFWKARSTIANQQRLFVAQVFELHRLIKVQKLIAESPDLMFDEGAYLGNLLNASAPKRVRLNHEIEPILDIDKHRVVCEKTNQSIQNLEKAVEKTPISSSPIDNKLSNYKEPKTGVISVLYRPEPPILMMGNYLNHRLRPHYPVFSPAISFPPSLILSMPQSLLSLDRMEALHKCYENIYNMLNHHSELLREVLKFSPSNNNICVSMANATSLTTQTNPYTPTVCSPPCDRLVLPLMPPSLDSIYKIDYHHKCYQTLCNVLNQNTEFSREVMKLNSSIRKVSMASTSSPTTLTTSCTLARVKQPVLSISPMSPAIDFGTSNQPFQDVLHENARSETRRDESNSSFNSTDDDFDSDYLSSFSDTCPPSSPANDVECDRETRASDSTNKMDDRYNCDQSTCNMLNQNSGLAAEEMKLTQSDNLVVHASMACTSIQAAQISSSTSIHRVFETPVVSNLPPSLANNVGTPN